MIIATWRRRSKPRTRARSWFCTTAMRSRTRSRYSARATSWRGWFSARSTRNLSKPGLVVVGCTVHAWIYSYVWVCDHPFYSVTRDDGSFQLPFVYPGTYKLTAWHAEIRTQTQEVVVGAEQVLKVNFSFPAPRITQ